jgi:hypothetical protein
MVINSVEVFSFFEAAGAEIIRFNEINFFLSRTFPTIEKLADLLLSRFAIVSHSFNLEPFNLIRTVEINLCDLITLSI